MSFVGYGYTFQTFWRSEVVHSLSISIGLFLSTERKELFVKKKFLLKGGKMNLSYLLHWL